MSDFIDLIISFYEGIAIKLANATIEGISLLSILVGAIVISIIINYFWKGAKG